LVCANVGLLDVVDEEGRIPRLVRTSNATAEDDLEFVSGWSKREVGGCRTTAEDAILRLRLPPMSGKLQSVIITGNAWLPPDGNEQVVSIGLGLDPRSWVEMVCTDEDTILEYRAELPTDAASERDLLVNLWIKHARRPSDYGEADDRLLGYKFRSLRVFM
jgi:hypothetical protein